MKIFLFILLFIFVNQLLFSQNSILVTTHNQDLITTDPKVGNKSFCKWGVFPTPNTEIRRITLKVTMGTPIQDSMRCADWDYSDAIRIRRVGGKKGKDYNYEFARMLTPYGGAFRKGWSFQWEIDVTDFSLLLRDSVEIEYMHSGYEPPNDRGWAVTIDFEIEKGKPALIPIAIYPVYTGNFLYGDTTRNIENELVAKTYTFSKKTDLARIYILQTGHGMDEPDGCSEFCSKYREIYWDNELINKTQLWRKCGDNSLYPQAGTWIFDRAHWCPGYLVEPDILSIPVKPKSTHTLDLNMESYISTKPSARQSISSYIIEYKTNTFKNDVAVFDVKVPSKKGLYNRFNPSNSNPIILVKNNSSQPVYSFEVEYRANGIKSSETEHIISFIKPYEILEVKLVGKVFQDATNNQKFEVNILKVNGKEDEYPIDNQMEVEFDALPEHKGDIILVLETNNNSNTENEVYLYNMHLSGEGKIINYPIGSLDSAKLYRDTLQLTNGDYYFNVKDSMGNGLDFWFMAQAGTGKCYLTNHKGEIIKYFNPDFGSSIDYYFRVNNSIENEKLDNTTAISVFPTFTKGEFEVSILSNKKDSIEVKILDEFNKIVQQIKTDFPSNSKLNFDISEQKDGRYFVEIIQNESVFRKRVQKRSDLNN